VTASIHGLRVGHWTDADGPTGCTVLLLPGGTLGSVFVAGGAPATRETDLLLPGMLNHEVHAILLAGGSAFGLAAADGVMRWLEERGAGFDTGVARVPIVPAAAVFDLWPGDATRRPGPDAGYAACETASDVPTAEGNIGAGAGATVGKAAGPAHAMKGGLGWSAIEDDGLVVACLAVVNAFGDVISEDGGVLAGARAPSTPGGPASWSPPSTTLCCVVTNGDLSKEDLHRVARMATAGLARAVRPVLTMFDGDVVFALATRTRAAGVDHVGSLAADATAAAVRRGVLCATGIDGVPAHSDGTPNAT
jgi:L-aminopeptidase/D-esterase-like protein